jgi:hypothetical protein
MNSIETEEFSIQDIKENGSILSWKYKSVLKLDTNKNKIYVKFHKNADITDVGLNNDIGFIRIQHVGYDMVLNRTEDIQPFFQANISLAKINNSHNVYVLSFSMNKLLPETCGGNLVPLIKVRDDEFAIYDYLIINIFGDFNNFDNNTNFVTFSIDPFE